MNSRAGLGVLLSGRSDLGVSSNAGLPAEGTPPPGGPPEMFLSRDESFRAEDTVDRGSVSVPWGPSPPPHEKARALPLPSSLPPNQREPSKDPLPTPTNTAPAAQAFELRRASCRRELERGRSQKSTLASNLFFGAPSSQYLENLPGRQGRKLPSPQCLLQEETNAGQGG